ncbi:hypothetical protein FE840_016155 [Peteryoungia desertarenae]|uniref:Lipoprotein n=1 Tax=Peteryoungia desertarenae TaxID=1813451 RepID=A0ABX6QQS1_9HYPH|nr:hypothetical protein [Peteryoungia desertarenae]QLF70954.1 hypothetical protein FE840_016155 [Peteryoungia desertarenae]
MQHPLRLATLMLLLGHLASCNSTEVLTPQVDVGNGSQTNLAMSAAGTMPAPTGTVQSAPLSSPQQAFAPQNTLEAQAAALQQGVANPSASLPLDSYPAAPQSASASWQQPMPQSTAQAAQPQSAAQAETSLQAPQQSAALTPAPATTATGSIRFLPIIGAPVQAVTPLSRQLGSEARARGLTIKSASDPSSEHILKGYFSAFGDGGKVNVVYVWDILDANGGRLHRLQGQESFPSNAQDPWAAVPASVMQQIAARSINDYVNWRNARPG